MLLDKMEKLAHRAIRALKDQVGSSFEVKLNKEEGVDGDLVVLQREDYSEVWQIIQADTIDNPQGAANLLASSDIDPKDALILSPSISKEAAELLQEKGQSYLDARGNCFLQGGQVLIFINGEEGERTSRKEKLSKEERIVRAFNKSGLRLIFSLLANEELADRTYRELSQIVGISRGAVGYVMRDLQNLSYLQRRGGKRRLRKKEKLIQRWTQEFGDRLRPKLHRGRFEILEGGWESYKDALSGIKGSYWGGEPAADLLTGNLRPKHLTVYTGMEPPEICETLGAVPDPEGNLEVLDRFWDPDAIRTESSSTERIVPPLLVYADLVASADPRTLNVAEGIFRQYLDQGRGEGT